MVRTLVLHLTDVSRDSLLLLVLILFTEEIHMAQSHLLHLLPSCHLRMLRMVFLIHLQLFLAHSARMIRYS